MPIPSHLRDNIAKLIKVDESDNFQKLKLEILKKHMGLNDDETKKSD